MDQDRLRPHVYGPVRDRVRAHPQTLGRGESESIALAYHTGIKVLIDDLKARKFAVELGCSLSGTIGVLYKMEQKETIDSAFKEIIKLKELGFRISEKLIHKLSSK